MPRRNTVFDKARGWRAEDIDVRGPLHLRPEHGAPIGEYTTREPGEYSDSYYGPGDAYPRRQTPSLGYVRDRYVRPRDHNQPAGLPGRAFRRDENAPRRERERSERTWADLGVHSTEPRDAGVTERSFRGRGPRDYRRSDERLHELVCERLTDDPHVDASNIEIRVENGEITLSGAIHDRTSKWRAEDLAEDATGGALIHNRLRVQQRTPR